MRETATTTTLPVIERRLLWEQDAPILDVASVGERMLVLDTSKLSVLERRDGRWEPVGSATLAIPPVRDPRGKLQVTGNAVAVFAPGATCRGTLNVPLELKCEAEASAFSLGRGEVRFTSGRNTLDRDGRSPIYSLAQAGSGTKLVEVAAETDGFSRIYDQEKRPVGTIEEWGSDVAAVCGGKVLATANKTDQVKAYLLADQKMAVATEPMDLPGTVTAMWSMGDGAVAIVFKSASGRYAAYGLSLDCGH